MATQSEEKPMRKARNRKGARVFVNGQGPYPTEWKDGVHRFLPNPIFKNALERFDVNLLWIDQQNGIYTKDHMREFYRHTGVSLAHYAEVFPDDKIRYRVTSVGVR